MPPWFNYGRRSAKLAAVTTLWGPSVQREEVIRLLRTQPFKPIRLRLSNGFTHDIRHSDMAIVTPSTVYVGIPHQGATAEVAEDIVIVSLMHVLQMEYLVSSTPTSVNQSQ